MSEVLPIEEWGEKNGLSKEIKCHISELTDLNEEEAHGFMRMVLISARQSCEPKKKLDEEKIMWTPNTPHCRNCSKIHSDENFESAVGSLRSYICSGCGYLITGYIKKQN